MSRKKRGTGSWNFRSNVPTEEIVRLHEVEKFSCKKIADIFGMHVTSIIQRLDNLGINRRPSNFYPMPEESRQRGSNAQRGKKRGPRSEEIKQKIRSGRTGKRTGESNPSYRHDIRTEEIVELRQRGISKEKIAKLLAISSTTVTKRLEKHNQELKLAQPACTSRRTTLSSDEIRLSLGG